jgi:hypothetical protein
VRALRWLCCVSYSRGRLGQSYGPWCRAPNNAILLRRASAKLLVCSADTETVTAQRPLHKGYRARSMDSSRPSFLAPSCSASINRTVLGTRKFLKRRLLRKMAKQPCVQVGRAWSPQVKRSDVKGSQGGGRLE